MTSPLDVFQHVTSHAASQHLQKSLDIPCGSSGAVDLAKLLVPKRGEARSALVELCPMLLYTEV